MKGDERVEAPELQGRAAVLAISLVVAALAGGSLWGWSYAGPLGGLLGVLLGTAVGALAFTIVRAFAGREFGEPAAPDVRDLPPDQAMQVLTALMAANASGSVARLDVEGGLLAEIGKARARANGGDVDGALAQLRALRDAHPRSPAVPLEITRVLAGHDQDQHVCERRRAIDSTITLAIRGGMNRLAAELYETLDDDECARIELDDEIWDRLAKVFAARDHADNAAACRARARRSPNPNPNDSPNDSALPT